MEFPVSKCEKCGKISEIMISNNPIAEPICFDCIKKALNYNNLQHGDFFCRTYNLPFKPEVWMNLAHTAKEETFKQYAALVLEDSTLQDQPYDSSTSDLWAIANKEWEKCRTQTQLINRIGPIKDSYVERSSLKWGNNYSFEELVKLDSLYNATLRANNIVSPLQKEAVKMLCKIHIELNNAMLAGDTKAVKDFTSAYSNFAKEAGLDAMIEETKTDDITTVAELYDYMEQEGFQFKFYDGFDRDEVDTALKDINNSNRRLILESTGLSGLLESMAKQRMKQNEEQYTQEVTSKVDLQKVLEFNTEETEVETEEDKLITEEQFEE